MDKNDPDYKNFERGFLLFFMGMPAVLGALQFLGGFNNALYFFSRDYNNIYVLFSWAVLAILWLATLWRIHLGGGAKIIIKFKDAFRFRGIAATEHVVKVIFTLMILVTCAALIIGVMQNVAEKAPDFVR